MAQAHMMYAASPQKIAQEQPEELDKELYKQLYCTVATVSTVHWLLQHFICLWF